QLRRPFSRRSAHASRRCARARYARRGDAHRVRAFVQGSP
ncbi:MAG: hypothetical protein GWN51_14525, partial [Gemmatimonadetes bacterium]|nr:hypothetical protein [Gemmatimonadota bacterium]NIT68276.1 hypothetical protein [Gemmatimonadota bacterium]NIU54620.1 hypothetical protein [Gemmatimonadota bacterium]NIV24847.1 hypothetical protein [Gemmatimonadota bacterium]NIW38488.1 hypothetical protein [Gemmatimonadota bacterium]